MGTLHDFIDDTIDQIFEEYGEDGLLDFVDTQDIADTIRSAVDRWNPKEVVPTESIRYLIDCWIEGGYSENELDVYHITKIHEWLNA